jgi:O-antigen ligase
MKDLRSWLLILISPCVTVIAFPYLLNDSVNLSKFLVLGIFSCGLLALLVRNRTSLNLHKHRVPLISVGTFVMALLVPMLFSGSPFELQLYGTYGRNTGFLTALFFIIVFISALTLSHETVIKRITFGLILAGSFEALYAALQVINADPINWRNREGWIFGTFFNPNFLSAFLGIVFSAILVVLFTWNLGNGIKLVLLLEALLLMFVIFKSGSVQGMFIALTSATILVFLYTRKLFANKFLNYGYISLVSISVATIFMGFLQKGPLKSLVYQESITFRGDYWRAGWKMFTQHPITGVGLDSFGDWYSYYRTSIAATRHGPDIVTNSAHNIFLDYAASGGILLLFSYMFLNLLVIRKILEVTKCGREIDGKFWVIAIGWIGFTLQSMISVNSIGLSIWGWLFAGLIIGYEKKITVLPHEPNVGTAHKGSKKPKKIKAGKPSSGGYFVLILGLLAGLLISLPPFLGDMRWKSALGSGDAEKLASSIVAWPKNSYRFERTAAAYLDNGAADISLIIVRNSLEFNSRSFDTWRLLAKNTQASQAERDAAIEKMKSLDPMNNEIESK